MEEQKEAEQETVPRSVVGIQNEAEFLPVLSVLSEIDWKIDPAASLRRNLLVELLHGETEEHQKDWFDRMFKAGRFVFLLDALDQTTDDLAGFGSFLKQAAVYGSSILLTGREERVQTRGKHTKEVIWQTLHLVPFDEERQRAFLSQQPSDVRPLVEEEVEKIVNDKDLSDLRSVPMLLHMLRDLARAGELAGLKTREAIYERAIDLLCHEGRETLGDSVNETDLISEDEVQEILQRVAWKCLEDPQSGFTAVLVGKPFRKLKQSLRSEYSRDVLKDLRQVNITTLGSVLDQRRNREQDGLLWRHRPFLEYYAAIAITERLDESDDELKSVEDRATIEKLVQGYGRSRDWKWVFRFALARMQRLDLPGRATLVRWLIQYGNPFLVYESIRDDGLTLDGDAVWLNTLCRWLVRLDQDWGGDEGRFRSAWNDGDPAPVVDASVRSILQTLMQRSYRDSRCLYACWEFLAGDSSEESRCIRHEFLGELARLLKPDSEWGSDERKTVAAFLDFEASCATCPPLTAGDEPSGGFEFLMGSPDEEGDDDEHPQVRRRVSRFKLQKTTVTNRLFELFDPSHVERRGAESVEDDCPVIYVNWHMAQMFCLWLSGAVTPADSLAAVDRAASQATWHELPQSVDGQAVCRSRSRPLVHRKLSALATGCDLR